MKTVIIDRATRVVVNVGTGEPESNPADRGQIYLVVEDDFYVGPGFELVGPSSNRAVWQGLSEGQSLVPQVSEEQQPNQET